MFLLVDKPQGMTSHDVVDRIRDITGEDTVGHGGTLDPNATGLLIVGVTRDGTKRLSKFTEGVDKSYTAVIELGKETDTLDVEGEVVAETDCTPPDREQVQTVLASFAGIYEQVPPKYSAVRVNGRRAYKLAREGKDFDLPPRPVEIKEIAVTRYDFPELEIDTTVGSGTYIRSLARDIGNKLSCGGFLRRLRRWQVGEFHINQAHSLEDIKENNWRKCTINPENVYGN